jgi:hypothetical protein
MPANWGWITYQALSAFAETSEFVENHLTGATR